MPEQNEMQKTYLSLERARSLRNRFIGSGMAFVALGAAVSYTAENGIPLAVGIIGGLYTELFAMDAHDAVKSLNDDLAYRIRHIAREQ